MTKEAFWMAFLAETGLPAETRYESCFHFELTEKWANALLALVLSGQKRATCSSQRSYEIEGKPLPRRAVHCDGLGGGAALRHPHHGGDGAALPGGDLRHLPQGGRG